MPKPNLRQDFYLINIINTFNNIKHKDKKNNGHCSFCICSFKTICPLGTVNGMSCCEIFGKISPDCVKVNFNLIRFLGGIQKCHIKIKRVNFINKKKVIPKKRHLKLIWLPKTLKHLSSLLRKLNAKSTLQGTIGLKLNQRISALCLLPLCSREAQLAKKQQRATRELLLSHQFNLFFCNNRSSLCYN